MTVAITLAVAAGCRKAPPPPPPPPVAPAVASAAAPDRLAPGELPPGQEQAHDLVLPRGAHVDRHFGTTIHCTVPEPPESFANWVRAQADEADAEAIVGPSGTVFPKLHVRGAQSGRHLRVEIARGSLATHSLVTVDLLPEESAPPPPISNEEAMKKAGLTPDGKWLDPKHLE